MKPCYSKLTSQGQTSVPAEVRRKLGLRPSSSLRWEERDGPFIVERASRHSSMDIHRALFSQTPTLRSLEDMERGLTEHARRKHASR